MVAGARYECIWKFKKQNIKVSSESVISWVKTKLEFTRGKMEKLWVLLLDKQNGGLKN